MLSSGSRRGVAALLLLGALGTGCGVSFNQPPKVTEGPVASEQNVESGAEVQMHLVVSDKEGEKLRFNWVQTPSAPAGEFSDASVQEPSWIAPEVTQLQTFQLSVVIKDAEQNTLQGFTSITVYPRR
jgi:uncharacterized protein (DUF58 family)